MTEFPPVGQLMPHGEPMILLDQLQSWSPGHAECSLQVRAGSPFVDEEGLPTAFTLEHMAQTVAVCLGYEAYRGGEGARVGMIVSCRSFEAHVDRVAIGDELAITVGLLQGNASTSHFECLARRGEEPIASATLTLFYGELPER